MRVDLKLKAVGAVVFHENLYFCPISCILTYITHAYIQSFHHEKLISDLNVADFIAFNLCCIALTLCNLLVITYPE